MVNGSVRRGRVDLPMSNSTLKAVLAAVVISFSTPLLGCRSDSGGEAPAQAPPLVEAVEARYGSLPVREVLPGVVRARNQIAIRPEIEARVAEVLVRSGEAVERGQPLVRLEEDEPRERLRQAEANVRLTEAAAAAARARLLELESRVKRSRKLAEEELISAQDLEILEAQLAALEASADEAEARVEQARATADERRSALEKTVVRSPVSGRLGERRVEVGMLVDPASVFFVAGDLDELIVQVTLPEELLAVVAEGQRVEIETREPSHEPVRAEISRISPFLEAESFTTVAEIDVTDSDGVLRPGMFVTVRVLVGETTEAVLIPVAAVWENPDSGERGAFVLAAESDLELARDGAVADSETPLPVSFRRLEVIAEGQGVAGVRGLEDGSWVVTVGQHLLGGDRAGSEPVRARVRPVSWERVLTLQSLQSEDLLDDFLAKQRQVAAALGAEIPESEDVVDSVLDPGATETPTEGR